MENKKFISANVRELNTPETQKKIYSWPKKCNTGIILLQETHLIEKYKSLHNRNWKGKSFYAFRDATFSKGVSILVNKEII